MTLKYYDSPFHVTHDADTANKIAMKVDLSIMISNLIKDKGWTQKGSRRKARRSSVPYIGVEECQNRAFYH